MSNEVYGYLEAPMIEDASVFFEELERRTGIGIKQIPFSELYNFPQEKLPTVENRCVAFIIGDRPGKQNASYLIDYLDYAPEADISFPKSGKERLALLVELLTTMIHDAKPGRLVVAITECSQIEEIKNISVQDLGKEIYEDFERCESPPDCVYDVVVD